MAKGWIWPTNRFFKRERADHERVVTLPMTLENSKGQVMHLVDFIVIWASSAYNIILGHSSLNKVWTVASTYHMCLKFPTNHGIVLISRDLSMSRKCYLSMASSKIAELNGLKKEEVTSCNTTTTVSLASDPK